MILIHSVIFLVTFTSGLTLYEGEDCTLQSNNQKGKCISVRECGEAKKLLESNQRPQHCGFNRQTELVCCPLLKETLQRFPGSIGDESRKYYDAGTLLVGVSNGEKASATEFPHMAAVGYPDGNKIIWLCGGSLISDQFVLTAAHCAETEEYGPPTVVRLGDLDLFDDKDDASPQDFGIAQIITHPMYKRPSVYHDIALIKLKAPVGFGLYIKPACFHYTKNIPTNILQVVGWGKTDFFGKSSSHLLKANLTVISYDKCVQRYPKESRRLANGIDDNMQICAGDNAGKDTCPGDSGGGLLHFLRDSRDPQILPHFAIVGVTSFGKGCGVDETVGVYIRVQPYVQWIDEVVWG